jgi:HD-GYP domain-containing protein (c-di-GMP phosphodiesterase class II)
VLILPIEEATAGVTLGMPVMHPHQPGQQLLKAGYTLDEAVLGRLRELQVPYIFVDYPGLGDLDKLLLPTLSPARAQMYHHIRNTISAIEKTAQPTVTFPDYYAVTRELVITLLQQGSHPVYMDLMSSTLGNDEVAHATAVAHLSLMLGIKLEQYLINQRKRLSPAHAREVVNLGVGGMLHDLGKAKLPKDMRKFNVLTEPQTPEQREAAESHVQLGYDMVRSGIEPSAAVAVLHHHQRYDGTGYPAVTHADRHHGPLEGDKIHIFARIIAAADLFDHLTPGANGRRRTNIEILHEIRTQHTARLDPEIARVLPAVIPPFPPGMKVKISDGTTAVVTNFAHNDPYQPTIRRLNDDGALEGDNIDLREAPHLRVASIDGVSTDGLIPERETPARKAAA